MSSHITLTRTTPTALVLGGGFGGLEAAIQLRRRGVEVTLVSASREMFVYPTSIWLVTGEHERHQDTLDLETLAHEHGFRLVVGSVTRVDSADRSAVVDGARLSADFLILALGCGRRSPPGVEHAHTIWGSPEDTLAIRQQLETLVERGRGSIAMGFGGNPDAPSAVRGGPVFEVLFNVDLYLRRRGLRDRFELHFFAPMPRPGIRMGEHAAAAVESELDRLGIARHAGKKIAGFDASGVRLEGDARIDADLVVFVPAGAGHPVLREADLPLDAAGFVRIDEQCRVVGRAGVYAIGDVAALDGPEWRAKQGHVTVAMAKVAVRSIIGSLRGTPTRDDYREHVDILCIMDTGNGAALVHRTQKRARLLFLPWVGHLLKQAWGHWYRWTRRRFWPWRPSAARLAPQQG